MTTKGFSGVPALPSHVLIRVGHRRFAIAKLSHRMAASDGYGQETAQYDLVTKKLTLNKACEALMRRGVNVQPISIPR